MNTFGAIAYVLSWEIVPEKSSPTLILELPEFL